MRTYLAIAKYYLIIHLRYPWEIVATITRKLISLLFLIYFWYVVAQSKSELFDVKYLLSYFLISSSIHTFVVNNSRFGRKIQNSIKSGFLTNYLIKPANPVKALYAGFMGDWAIAYIYSLGTLIIGLVINPPSSIQSFFLFVLFMIIALTLNYSINKILGTIAFLTPESNSYRHVYDHIYRVLSGQLIPLTFFPTGLLKITQALPFPYLNFAPTNALQQGLFSTETLISLGIGVTWATIFWFLSNYLWDKYLKEYEGIGI